MTDAAISKTCRTCEYFDIGAADEHGHSDCLNRMSPRFQTYAHETCPMWMQASEYSED